MSDIITNIDKLHTTPMGVVRIRRNLGIDVDNVVEYCRTCILSPESVIKRRGKNYYVYGADFVLTINAASNTIITAHRL